MIMALIKCTECGKEISDKAFLNQHDLWVDDLNKYNWIKLSEKYGKK